MHEEGSSASNPGRGKDIEQQVHSNQASEANSIRSTRSKSCLTKDSDAMEGDKDGSVKGNGIRASPRAVGRRTQSIRKVAAFIREVESRRIRSPCSATGGRGPERERAVEGPSQSTRSGIKEQMRS
jgi:hypothetical protein